jgi:aryl-alcohol dehydrogenase-like predicted oxidoreductase
MKYRELGRTGWKISEISFGAWAIGGAWGEVDDRESLAALHRAVDLGVNFFDTADVYGVDERTAADSDAGKHGHVPQEGHLENATKAGRRLDPHVAAGYNRENLSAFIDRSLQNLKTDALDLLQLHCPPTDVYYRPEVFAALDDFVKQGKIRFYGVSVERVEEALKAIEYPACECRSSSTCFGSGRRNFSLAK